MTILLVRHARAGSPDRLPGDDRLRPLSHKGRLQADQLAGVLAPWIAKARPVLLASPWVRCLETLQPLAAALGQTVAPEEAIGEGMATKTLEALGSWLGRRPVVLCTHGDVIETVLTRLSEDGVDLVVGTHGGRRASKIGAAKGSVWVLDGSRRTVSTARYLPPPC